MTRNRGREGNAAMSKLADAIRRTGKVETPHIGFSPEPTKKHPTMLLAALVNGSAPAGSENADVVLTQAADKPAKPSKDGQLQGVWLQDGKGDTAQAREQGFDFIVFGGDEAPASLLLEEEAGLMMQVQPDLQDSLLQALQWMPLDALIVRWEGTITVRRQLELQRLSGFSRKPLFLFIEGEPQTGELEALREAGVIGIVVDLSKSGGDARLKALRERIDSLRPRPRRDRRDDSIVSITPAMVAVAPEPAEPDGDDDGEEGE
jgi:hypothetical protein